MDCTQPERYVLQRLSSGSFIAIDARDQSLVDVAAAEQAYSFHTHEAALRAANELNHLGSDQVDVVKLE